VNEDNFISLYAVGTGAIHLTGYTLKVNSEEEEDIFKALKPYQPKNE
jgi:hypothetical protein